MLPNTDDTLFEPAAAKDPNPDCGPCCCCDCCAKEAKPPVDADLAADAMDAKGELLTRADEAPNPKPEEPNPLPKGAGGVCCEEEDDD